MHMRDMLHRAPDPDAEGPTGVPTIDAPKPPPQAPTRKDWQQLRDMLFRMSPDWFSEAQAMMKSKKRLCGNIAHFPTELGTDDNFSDRMVGIFASPEADTRTKQAVVKALVKFNHAVIFSELGFVAGVRTCFADTVARAVHALWFTRYGTPEWVTTENGTEFAGALTRGCDAAEEESPRSRQA